MQGFNPGGSQRVPDLAINEPKEGIHCSTVPKIEAFGNPRDGTIGNPTERSGFLA
jgi:hypothetical protein